MKLFMSKSEYNRIFRMLIQAYEAGMMSEETARLRIQKLNEEYNASM